MPASRRCAVPFSRRDLRGGTLGVVLTGMGKDGLQGVRPLWPLEVRFCCQDEASSVVWGMPCHVVQAGLADRAA